MSPRTDSRTRDHPRTGIQVPDYVNLPTVCCVLLPWRGQLIVVRRGLKEGYGELALPGGFQEGAKRHTLHQTACKEVFEETGLLIEETDLIIRHVQTDELGHNLIFFEHVGDQFEEVDDILAHTSHDEEIMNVELLDRPVKLAFSIHTAQVVGFFRRKSLARGKASVKLVGS